MCIDLFRFGQRLDIEFLGEQVWFSVKQDNPSELDVTEVYDILIKNPKGCPVCSEVWALFPHSCYGGISTASLLPPPSSQGSDLSPSAETTDPYWHYNWLFGGYPRVETRQGRQFVVRSVADDYSPETYSSGKKELGGIPLEIGTIDFPDILTALGRAPQKNRTQELNDCMAMLSQVGVLKTLVRIPFPNTVLQETQTGWMRLVVKPIELEKPPVKRKALPGIVQANGINPDEYVISYEQTLEVTCPLMVRQAALEKLKRVDASTRLMRDFVDRLVPAGTSTRIEDHRIALVVPRDDMDICDAMPTTRGVLFYGALDLHQNHTAFLWSCGSCRNNEDDLIHNAMRAICKLALLPTISINDLASQLAPSTKFEAFSLLLNLLQDVHLLTMKTGDKNKGENWTFWEIKGEYTRPVPSPEDFDFNLLREKYVKHDVLPIDRQLVKEFRDLHSFRVLFRVVWPSASEKCRKLMSEAMKFLEKRESDG